MQFLVVLGNGLQPLAAYYNSSPARLKGLREFASKLGAAVCKIVAGQPVRTVHCEACEGATRWWFVHLIQRSLETPMTM